MPAADPLVPEVRSTGKPLVRFAESLRWGAAGAGRSRECLRIRGSGQWSSGLAEPRPRQLRPGRSRSRGSARRHAGVRSRWPGRISGRSRSTRSGTGPSAAAPAPRCGQTAPAGASATGSIRAAKAPPAAHPGPLPSQSEPPTWSPEPSCQAGIGARTGRSRRRAPAGTGPRPGPVVRQRCSGRPSGAGTATPRCRWARLARTLRSQKETRTQRSEGTRSRPVSDVIRQQRCERRRRLSRRQRRPGDPQRHA